MINNWEIFDTSEPLVQWFLSQISVKTISAYRVKGDFGIVRDGNYRSTVVFSGLTASNDILLVLPVQTDRDDDCFTVGELERIYLLWESVMVSIFHTNPHQSVLHIQSGNP
nr:hypothetical protein [Lentibacillus sp. CBA3610]